MSTTMDMPATPTRSSTALVANNSKYLSMSQTETLANHFVKSRLFKDCNSLSQAVVKIMAGREMGLGPWASMKGLYTVPGSGQITPNSNTLANFIRRSGRYDYEVRQLDLKGCIIAFYRLRDIITNEPLKEPKLLGTEFYGPEDAKRQGTQNVQKFPRNMYFARALTNGAKFYAPDICEGTGVTPYCTEEFIEEFDVEGNATISGKVIDVPATVSLDDNEEQSISEDQVLDAEILEPTVKNGENRAVQFILTQGLDIPTVACMLDISADEISNADDAECDNLISLMKKRRSK